MEKKELDLFKSSVDPTLLPLAERVRPVQISEIIGQDHILSESSHIFRLFRKNQLIHIILWGPPGTGKTTLAKNLADISQARFVQINAVDAGTKELKSIGEEGKNFKLQYQKKTLLFVDEIHRFNKSQQDILLPYVEKGDVFLIGATTEHPGYEINKALLSRCQVIELKKLTIHDLNKIVQNTFLKLKLNLEEVIQTNGLIKLIENCDGDARRLLNSIEIITEIFQVRNEQDSFPLDESGIEKLLGKKLINYDKKSDQHYDTISAFIKSMRGSDVDASLYYLARMLEGGEDPVFIVRRMIVFASEDIGNADPRALLMSIACLQAVEAVGMPEARINLSQVVCYLASCPKSNKSYKAINSAIDYVRQTGSLILPDKYKAKTFQNKKDVNSIYLYPHDYPKSYIKQDYWPEGLKSQKFYEVDAFSDDSKVFGFEKNIKDFLKWLKS